MYSQCGGIYPSLCGKIPENTFLIVTGVTTFLSVTPLLLGVTKVFPWTAPKKKAVAVDTAAEEAMKAYRENGDITWYGGLARH